MPVEIVPSFAGSHIRGQNDSTAVPDSYPGNLNPPKWAAQRWQFSTQQGILGNGGNKSESVPVAMTYGEWQTSTPCIQQVYAARSDPSRASLSTCRLNSMKAAAWRMLALVAAGISIPGSFRCMQGHPLLPTRSPLEYPRSRQVTPYQT